MKKLGFALMLVAIVAFVAVGSAAARNGSGSGSSVTASQSGSHSSSHGDDHGSGDDGQREPGEEVRGSCDEAEHANDASCLGKQTTTNSSSTSTSSNGTSKSTSGLAASTVTAGKQLVASVGPGFSITLKTTAGAAVKTLRAGTYTIVVRDRSPEHNFHLAGRAVNKASSPGSVSTSTWRVRFVSGTYSFRCDPHAEVMRGSLRVV